MSTKPVATLPLNAIFGGIFLLIAVASAFQHAWLEVGVWSTLLGLAFLLIGANEEPWAVKPIWRRVGAVTFLLLGMAALVVRLIIDFSNK